ncbi:hypothetical protein O181_041518 [Austropuccinia psidii MF-1]|uniref:Uncharacterized protein n=1 Tax=Austropuccinia psidii MF-1 TaxID=1389203 RepID=A0A9Q3HDV6_9BASI|nr:hypothetical protein [Austropuccinia psidii MF-1]
MSPVHLRKLGIPRNQPEDREGLSRTRRQGIGNLGQSGGSQETEGNNTHSSIHPPIQQKSQTRGLEGYGSSSSAPPTPQRSFPMEHGQQEVKASISGKNLEKGSRRYVSERYPLRTLWKSPKDEIPPGSSDSWRRGQPA